MELAPILAVVVLIATLSTLVLSVAFYGLFRAREPRDEQASVLAPKVFLVRLGLPDAATRRTVDGR